MINRLGARAVSWAAQCIVALAIFPLHATAKELPDFTVLVEKNAPAIVNISTIQKATGPSEQNRRIPMPEIPEGSPLEDWFRHFFGEEGEMPDDHDARSLGSGFVISDDGYVLTNDHVIEDADKIIVRLSDRRELEAELIGVDDRSDIALLKVDAKDLPTVKIGRSDELKPGEWVLAIGSPFGFDYSVTAGIVSAIGRNLPRENYVPFIQTDVAINPGNSGGPLFNLKGEVVGINSQIYSRTGGYMGLSFAIPIKVAMNVVSQLKTSGHVTRGWLGVLIQDVTRELAESFDMDRPQGALVAKVLPESPAEKSGFQVGDVIISFNGREVINSSDLPPLVGVTDVNSDVPVEIIREGKSTKLMVTIGELPEEKDIKLSRAESTTATDNRLNISVADLSREQRDGLENSHDGGVMVQEVERGAASSAGIRRGDIILMINNVEIKNARHFKEIVKDLPDDKSFPVLVQRRGSPIFLALKIAG